MEYLVAVKKNLQSSIRRQTWAAGGGEIPAVCAGCWVELTDRCFLLESAPDGLLSLCEKEEGVAHEWGWLVAVEWMKLPRFISDKILRAEHTSFVLCSL